MADTKQTFLLDLDIKKFTEEALKAKGSIQEIGNAENLSGLLEGLISVGAGLAVLGTAAFALKTTFDLVFEGEQIKRTNALFEQMADSIGVIGEKFKEDLVGAAKGLADDTDILNAANKAIVTMGDSAKRLPEIMDLARRVTMSFGGDMIERFEQLNYAIASGSQRMLRQNGIMLDTDKVIKDYAKSMGVTTDMLTEAGRKQAILNAALEYGKQRIKEVQGAEDSALTTSQQLKNALKEIGDTIVLAFEKLAGPAVRSFLKGLRDMAREVGFYFKSSFGEGAEKAAADIAVLRDKIHLLEEDIKGLEANKGKKRNFFERLLGLEDVDVTLAKEKKALGEMQSQLAAAEAKEKAEKENTEAEAKKRHENEKARTQEKLVDLDKLREKEYRLREDIMRLKEQAARKDVENASNEEELNRARHERQIIEEQDFQIKKIELERQANQVKGTLRQLYLTQIDALEQEHLEQQREHMRQYNAEYGRMLDNQLKMAQSFGDGFSGSARKAYHDAMGGMTQMARLGQTTFNVMKNRGSEMFQSFGKAAIDGSQSAADIMKGFFLNALGDIAQRQGELYLAMGLIPGQQEYLAAGAALLALSGVLHALGGSSGASAGSSISDVGGGGGGGGGIGGSDTSGSQAAAQATPQKSVTVQIMGHYFETEQTKTKLMDMIRDATDATDFKYVQIGQT